MRFRVSDEVQNLAQVKKGDVVTVSYYESVALRLRRRGDASPGPSVVEEAERAKPGELPAALAAEVVTATARVTEVDRAQRRVTVELPNNEVLTLKVRDPKRLDRLQVGDVVEATYREAIAVSVGRPSAP